MPYRASTKVWLLVPKCWDTDGEMLHAAFEILDCVEIIDGISIIYICERKSRAAGKIASMHYNKRKIAKVKFSCIYAVI